MSRTASRTAVVTIVHHRHQHLRAQQESLGAKGTPPDDYIVVAMDDPWLATWNPAAGPAPTVLEMAADTDNLPLAAARNRGTRRALAAGAEVIVFLDVDCLAGPGLVRAYADAVIDHPDVVWSGPVTYLPPTPTSRYDVSRISELDDPHPARPAPEPGQRVRGANPDLFWSLSFALHRDTWSRVGGFCEQYRGYGGEDTDFGHSVVRSGATLGWLGGARAYHQHHDVEDPPVRHLDAILRNGRVFRQRWGRWPMTGWLEEFERRGLVVKVADDWCRVPSNRP